MTKRKRDDDVKTAAKRSKFESSSSELTHPVLSQYFARLWTLRDFLIAKLPLNSKKRRRRLLHVRPNQDDSLLGETSILCDVCNVLDETIVGTHDDVKPVTSATRATEIEIFTQQLVASNGYDPKTARFVQSEIVDFVIWSLFRRAGTAQRPPHLLCHGYHRSTAAEAGDIKADAHSSIPGVFSMHRNDHAAQMKGPAWTALLRMLGAGGDHIMMDLLFDASIFRNLDLRKGTFYQMSGIPVHALKMKSCANDWHHHNSLKSSNASQKCASPSSIKIVRSRMLFAQIPLTRNHQVRFGLPHIHILNRCSGQTDREKTAHLLKYIFPRQFKLHNVFTSKLKTGETPLSTKDYTLREKEILQQRKDLEALGTSTKGYNTRLPSRLQSKAFALADELRKRHRRCAYVALLQHYCPVQVRPDVTAIKLQNSRALSTSKRPDDGTAPRDRSNIDQVCFTDRATSTAQISAFCRAVIHTVVPQGFWGSAKSWKHNFDAVMRSVDKFIRLRRFESLSLQQVTENVKIGDIPWLAPAQLSIQARMSRTDYAKRQEILHEFLFYLFDSFLIPLVRAHFHVTESNVHKQRLFYFRHDVWRQLAEPALHHIKATMFEEVKDGTCSKTSTPRLLGQSVVRLLPKKTGARPIMNLRRRMYTVKNGKRVLGRSINTTLAPAFDVLNHEKDVFPSRLASSLFSVGEIGPRLQKFKATIKSMHGRAIPFFFCKVDVKSCFDSIPQERLMDMITELVTAPSYDVHRHAALIPGEAMNYLSKSKVRSAPATRFKSRARPTDEMSVVTRSQRYGVKSKPGTIYVDLALRYPERRTRLLELLREHVAQNMVRIGRKTYRQKNGIPQGSVVSTLLCNLFYAKLEKDYLGFLTSDCSMLFRLLDDFLLITTSRAQAECFLQVVHEGIEEFGLEVKTEKSVANFDVTIEGTKVAKPTPVTQFPYCGILIDTTTLEVSNNPEQRVTTRLSDGLTVETKWPGQSFYRKIVNGFKIQLQQMFVDASLNSIPRVLGNLSFSFRQCALRSWQYVKNLPIRRRTNVRLLAKTIDTLVTLSVLKVKNANRATGQTSRIHGKQIRWLVYATFAAVFQQRQTGYEVLLFWLDGRLRTVRPMHRSEGELLERALKMGRVER